MTNTPPVSNLLLAALLAVAAPQPGLAASASHDHGDPHHRGTLATGTAVMATDIPLREGMDGIRQRAHGLHSPAVDTLDVAAAIEEHVAFIVDNCRLPAAADAALHVILAQVLNGVEQLRAGEAEAAAATLEQALGDYGRHFDHPGWPRH